MIIWSCSYPLYESKTQVEKLVPSDGAGARIDALEQCYLNAPLAGGFLGNKITTWVTDPERRYRPYSESGVVGYIDRKTGKKTNVTKALTTVGDFGERPAHRGAIFAPDGSFVFMDASDYDNVVFKFVDLSTMTVTRTQTSLLGEPNERLYSGGYADAFVGPTGEVERGATVGGQAYCGSGLWWLNRDEYLTTAGDGSLQLAKFAEGRRDDKNCGQRLSPKMSKDSVIFSAIASPDRTIYFLLSGPNGEFIYRANPADPDHPIKVSPKLARGVRVLTGWGSA